MRHIALLVFSLFLASTAMAETAKNPLFDLLKQENRNLSGVSGGQLNALLKPNLPRQSRNSPGASKIAYSRAWIDAQPKATGTAQWRCLSEALYFEARGETVKGQFAVAEVIMNRVDSTAFPGTLCKVIKQGTGRKYACQFSYTCDGHKEVISEQAAYDRAGKIARMMLDGAARDLTGGATYYHTKAVSPSWSRKFTRTATIGVHHFYLNPRRLSKK